MSPILELIHFLAASLSRSKRLFTTTDPSLLDSPPGSAASRNIHPGPLRKVSRLKIEVWSV
jgi:hypothetical protein